MKPIYTFTVGEGESEKKIAVLKPTYSQIEAAEFIFGQHFNKLIQDGYMSRAMMDKKFNDIGGLVSQKTNDEVNEAVKRLLEVSKTIEFYEGAKDEDLDEEQKQQLKNAENDYIKIQQNILEKDYNLEQMYNQSADAKAESHLMKWFTLECSYYYEKVLSREDKKVVEEKFELFEGANFEEKTKEFNLLLEEIEDNEEQELTDRKKMAVEALPTINKVLSLWYKQLATDQESMEKALEKFFPKEEEGLGILGQDVDSDDQTDSEKEPSSEKKAPAKKVAKKKATSKKIAKKKVND
jgi:hypothetical protein